MRPNLSHIRFCLVILGALVVARGAVAYPMHVDGATTGTSETMTTRDIDVFSAIARHVTEGTSYALIVGMLEPVDHKPKRSPLFSPEDLDTRETSPAMKNLFDRNTPPFWMGRRIDKPRLQIIGQSELARMNPADLPKYCDLRWFWLPGYDPTGKICVVYGFTSWGGAENGFKYMLTKTPKGWRVLSSTSTYTMDFM